MSAVADPVQPLLATKFFAPAVRPQLVPRERLLQRLGRGVTSKLTLLSAPPGFGKTTLLAEWLGTNAGAERSVAWLSLDEGDNNPAGFWTYAISALQHAEPGIGDAALALFQAAQPPPAPTLLTMLVNELAQRPGRLVLVLDDYHVIENGQVHDGLTFLLDHMPPQTHLVIASRSDPVLPLSRLRARGELTEIRAADLRFTPDEAAEFLNGAMGLELSGSQTAALESRTEGWIAALQLAALSMQGRDDIAGFIGSFKGDDRYIVDYLVDEVLKQQPENLRDFLLRTSILDRMSAPLCDAVTGAGDARVMLDALERGNLFLVPLDGARQWYRYHHLFADVLRAHLVEQRPDDVPALHRRASDWFASDAQPDPAIRHALAAKDPSRAAGVIEQEAERIARSHAPAILIERLKSLPDELIRSMPVLSSYHAIALQAAGRLEDSARALDDAERWLTGDAAGEMLVFDRAGLDALPWRTALGRGFLAIAAGDAPATVANAKKALALMPADAHHWRGTASGLLALAHWARGELDAAQPLQSEAVSNFERSGDSVLSVTSGFHDADLLKARGRLADARRRYERSIEVAMAQGGPAVPAAANLYIGLSELCCEFDDLAQAERLLEQADALGIPLAPPRTSYRYCLAKANLRRSRGDIPGAIEHLEEAAREYVRGAVPNFRPVDAWHARLLVLAGRLDEALAWTREQQLDPDDELSYAREYHHLTLARVLIACHQRDSTIQPLQSADALLGRLADAAEAGARTGALIEALVLRAVTRAALKDAPGALGYMERALALAAPCGYVRTFLNEGDAMRGLLRAAVGAGVGGDYARRLLAAFESPATTPAQPNMAALPEPLTPREVEILRLVAAGLQNQDIADHLVISIATVKRHIANTYGKLGVGHRTAAIARAAELSLL